MSRAAMKRTNDVATEPPALRHPAKRLKADKKPLQSLKPETRAVTRATSSLPLNSLPVPPTHGRPCNTVFVWGTGEDGQFGMGVDHLGEFVKPQRAKWFETATEKGVLGGPECGIEAVAAGGFFSLFVDEEGKVWSCGNNDDAALGRITEKVADPEKPGYHIDVDVMQSEPHVIQSLVDQHFRAVIIAAGSSISGAIDDKGELRVWGTFRASEGLLGFSSGVRHQLMPTQIIDTKSKVNNPKFAALAAGQNHMLALTAHGDVLTWGAGEDGQLGRRVVERRKIHGVVPEKVTLGSKRSRKAVSIGAGGRHSFAVDEEGNVWAWGMDAMGQTGTDRGNRTSDPIVLSPTLVPALARDQLGGSKVVSCVGGDDHTLFLTDDGRVYACGKSDGGRLGLREDHPALAANEEGLVSIPTHIQFPDSHTEDPVVHISVGTRASMAVTAAGALYCWGEANASELGIKDEETGEAALIQPIPKVIVKRTGGSWAAVSTSCGGQHVCAIFRKKQ